MLRNLGYIDLLNYMLKYKIPQIVTLTLENFKFINLKNKKVNNLSFSFPFT